MSTASLQTSKRNFNILSRKIVRELVSNYSGGRKYRTRSEFGWSVVFGFRMVKQDGCHSVQFLNGQDHSKTEPWVA